ncbi:MAG: NAD(P)/FAD-dependent oxidoreductase [Beijerinckiaceae bacterium]
MADTGDTLPRAADVLVIGGGIVGCSAALHLARQGISVVLAEKGRIAGEQSSRNWGWVRLQGRDPREIPLMLESRRIWRDIAAATGDATGFTQAGCLYLGETEKALAAHAVWLSVAHEFHLDTRLLSRAELETVLPGNASKFAGALYTPSDCRAEPATAVPAIAALAREAGAHIHENCAVRGVTLAAGRIAEAVTEHGTIRVQSIICAGGAWTSRFCASIGVDFPQLTARGSVFRTAPAPNILDGAAWARDVALRRRADGGYTVAHGHAVEHFLTPQSFRRFRTFLPSMLADRDQIRLRIDGSFFRELVAPRTWPLDRPSPFEETRALDPLPSKRILAQTQANLARIFPELAGIPVPETWAGMIEASPDSVPVLCEADVPRGFFIASGFSGHGFGIGPGAGKAIADIATGRDPGIDLSPFRLSRFFDGSPIRLGPGV